jgi:hypothetical protein
MNIINIDEKIQEWKKDSLDNLANYLMDFKKLTNLDYYISDDAENYYAENCYQQLLQAISKIVKSDIEISDIKVSEWRFSFKIDNNEVEIQMKDQDSDWFQEVFIENLNTLIIENTDTDKKIQTVYAHTEDNSDQCFDLCFITNSTHKILQMNTPRYAFNRNDYN